MNRHPRRDLDVILRLSKCTTDFLSFYIGFGSLSRVKMIVLDENIGFVRNCVDKLMFCRFFILIRGSCGDVLGIENQFSEIVKLKLYINK